MLAAKGSQNEMRALGRARPSVEDRPDRFALSASPQGGDAMFTRNDVLDAFELLEGYEGDVYGLFTEERYDGALTEWRLIAQCYSHGQVSNTIAIPASQAHPSAIAYVLCPECLEAGLRRRLEPSLVFKITEDK